MIDDDVAAHFESGSCSMVMATVGPDGSPHACRVWSVRVLPGGARFRALVAADDAVAIANLRSTGALALTAASIPTFEARQLKGRAVLVEDADADDRARFDRYRASFCATVRDVDGGELERIVRIAPVDVVAVVATADAVFDQTPGPGAGTRLPAREP